MTAEAIKTKFGNARLNDGGYYWITSSKEGNCGKLLHRLIFEDYYNITLPSNIVIHHEDEDKTNNEIWNLVPMTKTEHISFHKKGEKHHMYRKNHTISSMVNMSINQGNHTGFFRVTKHKAKDYTFGFYYAYQYYNEDKKKQGITSADILDLERKVKRKGFVWYVIDKELAEHTLIESEKNKVEKMKSHPTGIDKVYVAKEKRLKQGFEYRREFIDNTGKKRRLRSVDINVLKKKVLAEGLDWIVFDEEKARSCGLI